MLFHLYSSTSLRSPTFHSILKKSLVCSSLTQHAPSACLLHPQCEIYPVIKRAVGWTYISFLLQAHLLEYFCDPCSLLLTLLWYYFLLKIKEMNARKSCLVRISHFFWTCPSFQIVFLICLVMFWKISATPSNCWEVEHTLTHFHFSLTSVHGLLSIENIPAGCSRWTNYECHLDESIYLLDKASDFIGLDKEWGCLTSESILP